MYSSTPLTHQLYVDDRLQRVDCEDDQLYEATVEVHLPAWLLCSAEIQLHGRVVYVVSVEFNCLVLQRRQFTTTDLLTLFMFFRQDVGTGACSAKEFGTAGFCACNHQNIEPVQLMSTGSFFVALRTSLTLT